MINKTQIISGIAALTGLVLFLILEWPLAWVAIIMMVVGTLAFIAPFLKRRQRGAKPKQGEWKKPVPMEIGRVEGMKARYNGQTVPCIHLMNNAHTLNYMGFLPIEDGVILNPLTGMGWEIDSNPTEIFLNGVSMGMGYLCDELGKTVELTKEVKLDIPASLKKLSAKGAEIIVPENINEPVQVKIPDGVGGFREFQVPRNISVFARFEGLVGTIASGKHIQNALSWEPSSNTLLKNRLIFLAIGAFICRFFLWGILR